jgi:hypothetical protein
MRAVSACVLVALLAMPAGAADDVAFQADQKIRAVRETLEERAPATSEAARRDVLDAELSLRRAENRRKSGNDRAALKHAKKAEATLERAKDGQR